VEEAPGGLFILTDGERRLRAAKQAGLKTIPAVVNPPANGTAKEDRLTRALVTNLQRADLSPIEQARAFQRLGELGYSNIEISLKLGVSSALVASRLRLLDLDAPIQNLIERGKLPKDQRLADALLSIPDQTARVKMAQSLSARAATVKAGVEACDRLVRALQSETIATEEVPALKIAQRQAGTVRRPVWDAFTQVGKLPPWLLVEIAARKVCARCALRDTASAATCKGCPMVEMLCEMIGSAQ
jgi:ParB/RepB/Spo0J family partition protein